MDAADLPFLATSAARPPDLALPTDGPDTVSPTSPSLRLAVLVSGSGTNLQALLDAIADDRDFGGEVVVVGSDRSEAGGLQRARDAGIPTVVQPLTADRDRESWEAALRADLAGYAPDAVVLAGFMRILSAAFLRGWPQRVLNTHPSLLPAFRGAHAVRDALEHGVKVTGSTVHLVDEQVDHGPIVAQEAVVVHDDDTEASLHARIKTVEHRLLPAVVKLLCQGRLWVEGRRVHVRGVATAGVPPEVAAAVDRPGATALDLGTEPTPRPPASDLAADDAADAAAADQAADHDQESP